MLLFYRDIFRPFLRRDPTEKEQPIIPNNNEHLRFNRPQAEREERGVVRGVVELVARPVPLLFLCSSILFSPL